MLLAQALGQLGYRADGTETLARREPDMSPEVIRQRIEAFRRLELSGASTVSIDAQLPLAEIQRRIKREIWRIL